MKKNNKRTAIFISAIFFAGITFAQEALKSIEEDYYDFLSLQGITERPTLGYRTLSDSVWRIEETDEDALNGDEFVKITPNHPWQNLNLGTTRMIWENPSPAENPYMNGVKQGIFLKIYGPEWFNSFNTAAPYGQNDGALWQGKGYNTSLTGGARIEGYGLELTVKPMVTFSQNLEFEYIKPNYASGNAAIYGYYGVPSVDTPQRFGDKPFFSFDFCDTEIRYTWHNFTIGFGTQTIWLGPASLNPIIHSNNAPSYPKIDIGLRKQRLYFPVTHWYLGDIEFRGWWGKLSESDWFDTNENNNKNLIAGVSFSWGLPGIFKGLSIGFNRTMLSKWDDINPYSLFRIFVPVSTTFAGKDENDQRFSLVFDYILPKVGFELYLEWGRNDFSPSIYYIMRYPFHTEGWTLGGKKTFNISQDFNAELQAEVTFLECSADYDRLIPWYSTFYAHHIITQGYTNKGQWLGAGIGTGGNSQYLGFKLIYPKGESKIFIQRVNPDLDYTMYIDSKKNQNAETSIRALLSVGIQSLYFINRSFIINGGIAWIYEINPFNDEEKKEYQFNLHLNLGCKYNF